MIDFINLIANFYKAIFNLLDKTIISGGSSGLNVSLGSLLFVCILLGFVLNIFWKGVRA